MPRIGTVIRDVYRRPGADAVPGHLEARYGIHVENVTALDRGVLRVDRRDGTPWVARAHVLGRPLSRAEGDAEILRLLADAGFPAERCAHAEPVSEFDGRAVVVTEFVPGKPWPDTAEARRELGAMLGRMHALPLGGTAATRPAGSLHHLPDYEGLPGQDIAAAAAMLADLDGRVPPEHRETHEALTALLSKADDASGLPEAFLHPDTASVNAISGPDGLVLVDWTGAGRGPRLASLSMLLHSAGPKNVADVLSGYAQHQQLTEEERDRLEGVLWIRPLWLAAWQCWLAVVTSRGRTFVPGAARIAALASATRAAVSGSGQAQLAEPDTLKFSAEQNGTIPAGN